LWVYHTFDSARKQPDSPQFEPCPSPNEDELCPVGWMAWTGAFKSVIASKCSRTTGMRETTRTGTGAFRFQSESTRKGRRDPGSLA